MPARRRRTPLLTDSRAKRLRKERAAARIKSTACSKSGLASTSKPIRLSSPPVRHKLPQGRSAAYYASTVPTAEDKAFIASDSEQCDYEEPDAEYIPPATQHSSSDKSSTGSDDDGDKKNKNEDEEKDRGEILSETEDEDDGDVHKSQNSVAVSRQTSQNVWDRRLKRGVMEYLVGDTIVQREWVTSEKVSIIFKNSYDYNQKYEHKWQYFINDAVDNKINGWYDMDSNTSKMIETLRHKGGYHTVGSTTLRNVVIPDTGSIFSYLFDFEKMIQTNLQTGRSRPIQRVATSVLAQA